MFSLLNFDSSSEKKTESSSFASQARNQSYHSMSTATPFELVPQTTNDPFINQIKVLLEQNNAGRALRVLRIAIQEESKIGFITEETTVQDSNKIISERTSKEIQDKIASFEEARRLFNSEYQWFGFYVFGKPSLVLKIDTILQKLRETLSYVQAFEAKKTAVPSIKSSLSSGAA